MSLKEKIMKIQKLSGSYHQKPIEVFIYSPKQPTNIVTIITKGLYGVFNSNHTCGVNVLGNMLIESNTSHVVFYNSSRDFSITADSDFESRKNALKEKTFDDELHDLQIVIQHVIDRAKNNFDIKPSEIILYLHGTSVGGTVALMVSAKFPQIKKLSLCAPAASRGNSKKPIISSIPESELLFKAASDFKGEMFLLYGEEDTVVPKESSFAIINHATNARTRFSIVPKANHDFRKLAGIETEEAYKKFAVEIFNFLSSIE